MAIKDHRMVAIRTISATLLAAVFTLFGPNALGASININNHDFNVGGDFFDSVVPATGSLMYSGWVSYRPNGTEGSGQFYGRYSPDGTVNYNQARDKIAYIDLRSEGDDVLPCSPCDDGEYIVGVQQMLDPILDEKNKLQGNMQYILSVAVGNPMSGGGWDYSDFGGYRIELLAGTEVIGFDDNSKVIGEGDFETSSFSVLSQDLDVGLIGAALGVRLIHKNALRNPVPRPFNFIWGIGFDDVQLTVSAVPVPAAVWLFGTALLGLLGFGKRRKTA